MIGDIGTKGCLLGPEPEVIGLIAIAVDEQV